MQCREPADLCLSPRDEGDRTPNNRASKNNPRRTVCFSEKRRLLWFALVWRLRDKKAFEFWRLLNVGDEHICSSLPLMIKGARCWSRLPSAILERGRWKVFGGRCRSQGDPRCYL